MKNKSFQNSLLAITVFSFGLACFWAAFPPQPLGDLIFGFTKIPLFVFLVLICLGLLGVYISVILKDKKIARFHYWVQYFSERDIVFLFFAVFTVAIFFSWIIFIPNGHLDPSISEYQRRLMPLFVWMFFASLLFLGNIILVLGELKKNNPNKKYDIKIFISSIFILIVCVLIGLFIRHTKYGIIPIRHWEKNGVPVLFRQILILVWGITGWLVIVKPKLLKLEKQCRRGWETIISHLDTFIFLLIWLIAAVIWISEPLPFNMFNPGSIPPDHVHYPFSDALYGYDLTAQRALIGVEEQSLSKPAYSGFLFILHVFVGQNFELLLATQTAILAIFPAVGYLIGKKLYNRALGFAISFLIIVQTWNSIKGNLWIWKVAHPKMEMTDFPIAVVISIFVLFLINWYQKKEKGYLYLICSG
ncbi:MAG: hypothetical protein K8R40_06590, partial [Anaerolineaceae bacterium]|nr:hypothetical protein [Anaerolineaceae bacterium]